MLVNVVNMIFGIFTILILLALISTAIEMKKKLGLFITISVFSISGLIVALMNFLLDYINR